MWFRCESSVAQWLEHCSADVRLWVQASSESIHFPSVLSPCKGAVPWFFFSFSSQNSAQPISDELFVWEQSLSIMFYNNLHWQGDSNVSADFLNAVYSFEQSGTHNRGPHTCNSAQVLLPYIQCNWLEILLKRLHFICFILENYFYTPLWWW